MDLAIMQTKENCLWARTSRESGNEGFRIPDQRTIPLGFGNPGDLLWRRRRRRMYTGAVPLRNSRGPYYIQVSFVCYGYSLPFTISQPEYPVKHLPS
jgi:hypothetical protein